jgi:serine phosphatase RsbU (regulator of sigma subunit)
MDDNALDDLVRRLTALVGKLDQTYDQLVLMAEQQQEFNREQREFNREQLRINARLETLMTEVFRQRTNGLDA